MHSAKENAFSMYKYLCSKYVAILLKSVFFLLKLLNTVRLADFSRPIFLCIREWPMFLCLPKLKKYKKKPVRYSVNIVDSYP